MDKRATNEYEIHELLIRRWSPRAFAQTAITEEILASLFEAARWSASGGNEQPWRFIVTRQGTDAFDTLFSTLSGNNSRWAGSAPFLILSLAKTISDSGRPNRHAYYDLGQAVANLTAQATAQDIYVHQMGGFDVEMARGLFHVPAEYDLVTVIAIGYYGDASTLDDQLRQRETAQRTRKPLRNLVFDGAFGVPLNFVEHRNADAAIAP